MPKIEIASQTLLVDERPLLTRVPDTLSLVPDPLGVGAFLRVSAEKAAARLVLPLGDLAGARFTACHRAEPFWMTPKAGTRGGEVPAETQSLLVEFADGVCALWVPLIDGPFRASLQGGREAGLAVVVESGDPAVVTAAATALFVAVGADPYALVARAAESGLAHLQTGRLRRAKPLPAFVDQFGWCTWNAFYEDVSSENVRAGLASFQAGGTPPRLMILDDGWQSERTLPTGERRLTSFAPNAKFGGDLTPTVRMAKDEFGIATFLVWHAVGGYWGGVDEAAFAEYEPRSVKRAFAPPIVDAAPIVEFVWGTVAGVVPPKHIDRFYHDYHRRLRQQGVDGVKVDNQAVLEGVAATLGGRVALLRRYREALEGSAQTHFLGNLLNCMSNANEMFYSALNSTLTRTSTDFWPFRDESHGLHQYTNAQVGLWFGEFVHPDWDMFQSAHPQGAFHAAGRAVSGGPVYVSDKPDEHDFALLRKLVLPDGTLLRAREPGRPTRDCLFHDPTREPVLLKVFNHNLEAGVIGVFNARYDEKGTEPVSGHVSPADVVGLAGERFAVYAHYKRSLNVLARTESRALTLPQLTAEVVTVVPVDEGGPAGCGVAPLGLPACFNSAGAILSKGWLTDALYQCAVRGLGELLVWCQREPQSVTVDGQPPAEWGYDPATGAVTIALGALGAHSVRLEF